MTLKQLEAFYWAATCASFAVAAERLHLSVSSLSKRIAELEDALGQPLFDRSGHKAVLTDAGQRLLPQARELLAAADRIRASLAETPGLRGRCRFGVGELTALTWLPRLIGVVRAAYPDLVLEPYVDIGQVLEQRVADGELDFAVIAGRSSRPNIASTPIGEAAFAWAAAPAALAGATRMAPGLLARLPLVTLPAGAGTTRIVDDWLAGRDVAGERLCCNNWGAIAGLLIEGTGVGLLPSHWARALQDEGSLRVLACDPAPAALPYSFQYRRDDTRPLVGKLREAVLAAVDFSAPCRLP
ncbi:MAG: LysR family transcriptional regulator [Achromobacter sp.]|jgi:DNA-binding transcriptional LysR family regulator|uniref:HTH-type transcriptional activator CmpR n=1 Tax=Achromobacter insuavis TaxID=1287735 RepID=A0A6J4ZNB0_9BURK|nr:MULTISPECIES: LysR family transcriptional regulator [Achromobacter]MBN9640114.1 LysR family transcriptional regulator [Achromobacter sp.]CAB3623991.1 HTH-type transcriptional activator CmpR [Achromobacter insuavis]CUI76106.1 HTH-type transcriptional activator CmpR [Achromobacter sp. 2789STDY5608633]CUJ28380.1 HTH-type transcriptional activator CmpR [Achromobacter sp. 2789STDY5608628]